MEQFKMWRHTSENLRNPLTLLAFVGSISSSNRVDRPRNVLPISEGTFCQETEDMLTSLCDTP